MPLTVTGSVQWKGDFVQLIFNSLQLLRGTYILGVLYETFCARPAKNGKCLASNLSSMQSSMMSLMTGVQRDNWYVCSFTRFLRGTV